MPICMESIKISFHKIGFDQKMFYVKKYQNNHIKFQKGFERKLPSNTGFHTKVPPVLLATFSINFEAR